MNGWSYSVFGLRLRADGPIPGLVPSPSTRPADVQLWLRRRMPGGAAAAGVRPLYESPCRDRLDRPALAVWEAGSGDFLRFRYRDGAEFVIDRGGRRVWAAGLDSLPGEGSRFYLLGPVLTFLLRLRGVVCLHASAVAVDGRAVAFLGPERAGKSTTAAALATRGCPVLSDDVVALADRGGAFLAQPGYPRLCLRPGGPGALAAVGVPPAKLTPLSGRHYFDLDLSQDGYLFQRRPLPLAAVYLLDERQDHPASPCLGPLRGGEALLALLANTWAAGVREWATRSDELARLGRLATAVSLRRLRPHVDPAHLGQLCDMILQDFRQRPSSSHGVMDRQHG
jgi:hypothetical protein